MIFEEGSAKDEAENFVMTEMVRGLAYKYVDPYTGEHTYTTEEYYDGVPYVYVSEKDLYDYIHQQVPAAFQLLPDYHTDYYLAGAGQTHPYGGYENIFLRNLNAYDMAGLANRLNPARVVSIIGTNNETIGSFEVVPRDPDDFKWAYGKIVDTYKSKSGDKTVTEHSATLGSGMRKVVLDKSEGPEKEVTKHQYTTAQFQPTIIKELTGGRPVNNANFGHPLLPEWPFGYVSLMCPAEIQLVNPQGRRVGYDPSTGGYINEIPGVLFSPHKLDNWPQIIFIPGYQPGDWQVKIFPREAGGNYSVEVGAYFPDQKVTQRVFSASGTISAGQQREYNVKLSDKPDTTAPVTQLTANGVQGGGWFSGDVTLSLTSTDDSSGVAIIQYSLNGGASWQNYTGPVNLSSSGVYVMQYRSQDRAGNLEAAKSLEIKLDKTAPASGISVTGQAGLEGWYRGEVTLTLSASDDVSGVAGIEYSLDGGQTWQGYAGPFPISREGIYAIMHRGQDLAGNVEAYRTVEVKLDITPPSISGATATSPNASGWYNANVTVHFLASRIIRGRGGDA